jgi:dTDP-4-amino-4,6-dideoxygalactose transaminase
MAGLESKGIVTRQGTHAPPHLDFYARKYGIRPADYPNAFLAERVSITLPLYAGLSAEDSTRVVEALHAEFVGAVAPVGA